jgi:HK97 gp10 family phage protein
MPVQITVDDKEVQKAFDKLIKNVDSGELSLLGAEVVFDESQKTVAVDTGELKQSGEVIQQGDEAVVKYNADHAPHIEFGTSKQPAQPYLRPAMDNHRKIMAEISKKLRRALGL